MSRSVLSDEADDSWSPVEHRTPPHDIRTERLALSAMILSGRWLADDDDFYDELHRHMFRTMRRASDPLAAVLAAPSLSRHVAADLLRLTRPFGTMARLPDYVARLRLLRMWRARLFDLETGLQAGWQEWDQAVRDGILAHMD